MNHDKERTLLKTLLNKDVINQQEIEKAELYLSLSSTTFDNYPDAIQWLINNRAVSRDRQDQVKAAFEYSDLTHANIAHDVTEPEPRVTPAYSAPHMAPEQTKAPAFSAVTVPYEIYQYNLRVLKAFSESHGVPDETYTQAEENLKRCPYLFCHEGEIGNWLTSYFIEPVDLEEEDEILDAVSALQLYKLVTEQQLINPTEYDCCYWELLDTENERPFRNETLLAKWLEEQGCILSEDEVITLPANHLEHNQELVKQLLQKQLIKKSQLFAIFTQLAKQPALRFESEQRLLAWIKEQNIAPKKKRLPLFFILFAVYVVYRILSSALTSDESYDAENITATMPPAPAVVAFDSPDADSITDISKPATEDENVMITLQERDRYETALDHAVNNLNATIKNEQGASAATFDDIIKSTAKVGDCSTNNQITSCPFKITYHHGIPSYTTTIQFKETKGNVELVSEYDFALAVVDGVARQQ